MQPRKHVLYHADHADYTAPIGQHELDRSRSGIDLPCLADDDLDHDLSDLSNLSEVCISWRTFVKPNPKHDACGPANSVGCTRDGKYLCCICVEDCFHNENVVLYPII